MSEQRICQNCKQDFVIDAEDLNFYAKMQVPPPTFCWLCRAQRRFAYRNERILYKRKSDLSGADMFSAFAPASASSLSLRAMAGKPDSGYKVYDTKEWLSDDWDPLTYGREVDFSRPFLEQVGELLREVPLKSRNIL